MRQLWIHIGTPKTGSTALQRYSWQRSKYLNSKGVSFLVRRSRASYNDMGVAIRGRNVDEATKIGEEIKARIAGSDADKLVISSEMLTGGDPGILRDAIAMDETFDTKIIAYFRRQDRYFEGNYKQKMKTGKVAPGFDNYLAKFGTDAGHYGRVIDIWENAFPEAEFVFRRFEPARFPKGDVIRDFLGLLGLDIDADDKLPSQEAANPTPDIDMLDLMQIVVRMPDLDARKVFRTMPVADLPRFKGRAMSNAQARDLLVQFEAENDALRQRFFPDEDGLFDSSDLDGPEPAIATPSFTEDQRVMIEELLKSVVINVGKNKR
ncbi:MAG: hypothetical protein AAGH17_09460 [Pseudomonadota bacterium]